MKLFEYIFNICAEDVDIRLATLSVISYDIIHARNSIEESEKCPDQYFEYGGFSFCTSIKFVGDDSSKEFDSTKIEYCVKVLKIF